MRDKSLRRSAFVVALLIGVMLLPSALMTTAANAARPKPSAKSSLVAYTNNQTADNGELTCEDGWTSRESTVHPDSIRVWASCTGDYEADIAEVLAFSDEMWEIETEFLGPPIPDLGTEEAGGDPAIDFYLVNRGESAPREGPGAPSEGALASAHPTEPFEGRTTSSYVLAWREDVGTVDFRSTLLHEFFHVLQAAHNRESAFGVTALPLDDNYDTFYEGENWWVESSAVWAETYFGRQIPDFGPAVARTHGRFVNNFQPVDEALHRPSYGGREGGLHMYAAYIWWLFLEQEVGPEAVAEIWEGLEAVPADDASRGTDVIDAALPFAQHFRDFAVRNLNLALEPGNPISPRYKDLDPNFPDNIPPVLKAGEGPEKTLQAQDEDEEPRRFDDTIKSLSADYYYFEPDAETQQVTFDFSRLTPATALDVDAIVKVKDKGWERRQLDPTNATTWCRSTPADNVEAFYLILSNHEKNILTTIKGDFTIAAQKAAC